MERLLADAILVFHFAFVAFVVGGALLALRWPRIVWVHVPCAVWGVWVELAGWICPLTPLEQDLRRRAGEAGYSGGFIEHYVVAVLYPQGLTREVQVGLGVAALAVNVALYAWVWRRSRRDTSTEAAKP